MVTVAISDFFSFIGNHSTLDMWNYSNDFDIFREYANIVKDNLFEAEILRPYNVVYISRKANQTYAHSIDDIWAVV